MAVNTTGFGCGIAGLRLTTASEPAQPRVYGIKSWYRKAVGRKHARAVQPNTDLELLPTRLAIEPHSQRGISVPRAIHYGDDCNVQWNPVCSCQHEEIGRCAISS